MSHKIILSAHLVDLDQTWDYSKWDCKGKDNLSFGREFDRRTSLQLPLQLSAHLSLYKID